LLVLVRVVQQHLLHTPAVAAGHLGIKITYLLHPEVLTRLSLGLLVGLLALVAPVAEVFLRLTVQHTATAVKGVLLAGVKAAH
jgi:hypothetical protein